MKILFDHQAFTYQYYGGVSKCYCELINNLPPGVLTEISIKQSNNIHLREFGLSENIQKPIIDYLSFVNHFRFRGNTRIYNILKKIPGLTVESINKRYSITLIKEMEYDVFHPTYFDWYFLDAIGNKPFVLTIHDLMPELYSQYYSRNDIQILGKRKLLSKANAIIVVSKNTRDDLLKFYDVPIEKIHVIYHGSPPICNSIGQAIIDRPYFLFVGQRNAYKNFKQTLIDFSIFHKRHKEVFLVCTGNQFNEDETNFISTLCLDGVIKHIYANELQMRNLYANAIGLIFPSLYEGFGMPILEAFANKCPVLLNNTSCFPEIASNAAIFFESNEQGSNLPNVMESLFDYSEQERNNLITSGLKRLSFFSWEKSAKELANVYASLL